MHTRPHHPPRRARRRLASAGVGLIALVCILGASVWSLARARPGWWSDLRPDDPQVRATARAVENGVINHLHHIRPPDAAWTVTLKTEDANAWLAVLFPRWLEQHGNAAALDAWTGWHVDFLPGRIRLAARSRDGRYLAADVRPTVDPQGALRVIAERVRIGRLALPASVVIDRLPDDARWLAPGDDPRGVLRGTAPALTDPSLRLADGRRVRLVRIEPKDGVLWITCRTEPP